MIIGSGLTTLFQAGAKTFIPYRVDFLVGMIMTSLIRHNILSL